VRHSYVSMMKISQLVRRREEAVLEYPLIKDGKTLFGLKR